MTKFISERFGHGGIADRMIYLNGYPFLDSKEDHTFGVPVSQCMSTHIISLTTSGLTLKHLDRILATDQSYQGYPIIDDEKMLLGYIGRTELRYAVEKAQSEGVGGGTKCVFTAPASNLSSSREELDFSRYIDPTPLTVHPRLPLETVMELFKKMGPRVILIEYRGRLTGLVTIKDCLKYQFKVEAGHAGGGGSADEAGMERVFGVLKHVAGWVDGWFGKMGMRVGGDVRLRSPVRDERREREREGRRAEEDTFDVGEDEDDGVGRGMELEDTRGNR